MRLPDLGVLADGRPVRRWSLGDPDGLELQVLDLGAAVHQLWVPDAAGERANVVLGAADVTGYTKQPSDFLGATVGRFANRIARAELPIGDRTHRLVANDGPHALHGGRAGYHLRPWTLEHADEESLVLSLVSPDGDQGFPGELTVRVGYRVTTDEVRITYRATTTATTAVSLTNHAHFNLAGESSGSVGDHLLQVAASRCTPVGPDLLPLGEQADVSGTPFDFRVARSLAGAWSSDDEQVRRVGGVDHNFVLSAPDGNPAAVLADPSSGRVLELHTDRPGLQVYSGNFFDGTLAGTGGVAYDRGAGVALETQAFPDSPHHEGEPGWPSCLLHPDEVWTSTTTWRFRSARTDLPS